MSSSGWTSPSSGVLAALQLELQPRLPFSQMEQRDIQRFIALAQQRYYDVGEVIVSPAQGEVSEVFLVRRGSVSRGSSTPTEGPIAFEAGDMFPLAAAVEGRPVTGTYKACEDTFVFVLPREGLLELAAQSTIFAGFVHQRVQNLLGLSRQAMQAHYGSQVLAEHSFEAPLGERFGRTPIACSPETPLRDALGRMHEAGVGSVIVTDAQGRPIGILTRADVLSRVVLPGVPLDTAIADVMVAPVHMLDASRPIQEAALLMSRHAIRHVPVTRDGALAGVVSERDLFAMQRHSLNGVSATIRGAQDVPALAAAAGEIRALAHGLLGQGVHAWQLTALVSQLNDLLTQRLLELEAPRHGVDLGMLCWIALGSEGRGEQTIATDQDNALILDDGADTAGRAKAMAFGRAVNLALDACGFPLCRGGIMSGEPACCMTLSQWRGRFQDWIDQGAPEDLLRACIFFDLRAIAGRAEWADSLRADVLQAAQRTPRFLKQMALNALSHGPPLDWRGAVDTDAQGAIDLKLQGAALFVDAARIYGLASGVQATGTRARLEAAGARMGVPAAEYQAWSTAFEFIQMLRMRIQLESPPSNAPNRLALRGLNDIDRRILKEALRTAGSLQQRLRLDYAR